MKNWIICVLSLATLHGQSKGADLDAGRQLFAGACSACHGVNGEGGHGPSLVDGWQVRRASDQQLFNSIQKGVPGTDMPPSNFPDDQIQLLAAFVRTLSAPAIASAVKGDAAAGREIFFNKGGCGKCHMIRGEGGFPGPDLSDIGAKRTVRRLRESLLEPSARIDADFRAATVTTADGKVIRGVAKSYTNYSIGLLDSRGELHLLATRDVKAVELSDKSLMPGDYARRLSPQEIDNLIAFLSRQSISAEKKN